MQHEILAAMMGFPGSMFGPSPVDHNDCKKALHKQMQHIRYQCTPLACSLLSQGEVTAINRVVEYGGHISFLNEFVDKQNCATYENKDNHSSFESRSFYLQAVSCAIKGILTRYEKSICSLERLLIKDPSLGVGFIYGQMELKMRWIPWVTELILHIKNELARNDVVLPVAIGKLVLEAINKRTQSCGDEHVRFVLQIIETSW